MVTGRGEGVSNSLADKMGADGLEVKTKDMRYVVKAVRKILADRQPAADLEAKSSGISMEVKAVRNFFSRESN